MARSTRLFTLFGIFFIVSSTGCMQTLTERELIKPTAPEAEACVTRCDHEQGQCEARQRIRETECRTHYERLSADLESCRASPGTLCVQPDTCVEADMRICQIQHEECIVACGGRVETGSLIPSLLPKASPDASTP